MINVNERAKRLAAIMMSEIINEEVSAGKSPMAVAASILYICCKKLVIILVNAVSLKQQE
jgi:transcription initiation factor TFIIIB Brf1 subunit/transcription initiation factor TFIIB